MVLLHYVWLLALARPRLVLRFVLLPFVLRVVLLRCVRLVRLLHDVLPELMPSVLSSPLCSLSPPF
jgi:hypothetical protein